MDNAFNKHFRESVRMRSVYSGLYNMFSDYPNHRETFTDVIDYLDTVNAQVLDNMTSDDM